MTNPPIKYLQGNKVYLRPLEQSDAVEWTRLVNLDGESRRMTGTQRSFTLSQIERYIERIAEDTTRAQFGIVLQESDRLIGDVAIMLIHPINRSGSFRIAIMDDADLGHGYGSEAMKLMLDYGFGHLNLHRIELDVYSINQRAIRTYEKIGFKVEGTKREEHYFDHQYYDSVIMSILEHEYRDLHRR